MGEGHPENIIIVGFSGTGKSLVGQEVARRLGWSFVDTDEEIVRRAGKSIPLIFQEEGEDRFRQTETEVLGQACAKERAVIATGGGAVLKPQNRKLMRERGWVVCLEGEPESIHQRLQKDHQQESAIRPLLASPDPLGRIRALKKERQPYYAAQWTVHTDALTIPQVVAEVIRGWQYFNQQRAANTPPGNEGPAWVVTTERESYPVYVAWGALAQLGERMRSLELSGTAYLVSDDLVFPHYGLVAQQALEAAGFPCQHYLVAAGEESKSWESAARIYHWLAGLKAERGDTIVSLGGGVVGDLAGFVAATYLRGIALVHVPTTLLAMVDAAIGGKVAINLPQGKNLVGAFYQPRLVLTDTQTLTTLPYRELASGWAEVIKHALLFQPSFLDYLEKNSSKLLELDAEVVTSSIVTSVALKGAVVSEDEREQGRRTLLNYGHTIGHALEATTEYVRYLHGEAVAVGMVGAALLSQRLGMLSQSEVARHRAILGGLGLPTGCPGGKIARLSAAMKLDKKVKEGAIRWVLLEGIGQPIIRRDVPSEVVLGVLQELGAT